MPVTAGTVLTQAAGHLNDSSQLVYTSAVLLPFLNMAIQELEEVLAVYDLSPMRRGSITIDVPAESTTLPQMPVDFVEAISLYERPQDSSERWVEVHESAEIDRNFAIDIQDGLIQWTVRGASIQINPPSSAREVQLEYIAGFTAAANTGTALDIDSSRRYLALLTARNAARDLGNSPGKASTFEPDIKNAKDAVVRRLVKDAQGTLGVRRLPYRGRR